MLYRNLDDLQSPVVSSRLAAVARTLVSVNWIVRREVGSLE